MNNNLKDYIKYKFHNTLSKGTIALIGWLTLISLLFIIITSILVKITVEGGNLSFLNIFWISLNNWDYELWIPEVCIDDKTYKSFVEDIFNKLKIIAIDEGNFK